jgi:hypothetical protein
MGLSKTPHRGCDLASLNAIDLAFALDATGSMQPWIDQVRGIVVDLARAVSDSSTRPDLRLALVEYRDHGPSVAPPVASSPFLADPQQFFRALEHVRCSGGADAPEAVVDGLDATLALPWRLQAQKAIVLIGDAPPHGVGSPGDSYPGGCPCGRTLEDAIRLSVGHGIVAHAVAVTNDIHTRQAFSHLAKATGGEFASLTDTRRLRLLLTRLVATEGRKVAADVDVASHHEAVGGDVLRLAEVTGLPEAEVRASLDRLRAKRAIVLPEARSVGPDSARPSRVRIRR